MTRDEFTEALEQELRLRGGAFSRADLLVFVDSAWPLIEDDPDPARWAREYLDVVGALIDSVKASTQTEE